MVQGPVMAGCLSAKARAEDRALLHAAAWLTRSGRQHHETRPANGQPPH